MQILPLSTFCFAKGSCMVKDSKYNHGYVPTGIPNCFQISDHAEKWYIFQVHQHTQSHPEKNIQCTTNSPIYCSIAANTSLTIFLAHLIFQSGFRFFSAILPSTQMQYFDVETKTWKPFPSMAYLNACQQSISCYSAEYVGNYLYVATHKQSGDSVIYLSDIVNDSWETLLLYLDSDHHINCPCMFYWWLHLCSQWIQAN